VEYEPVRVVLGLIVVIVGFISTSVIIVVKIKRTFWIVELIVKEVLNRRYFFYIHYFNFILFKKVWQNARTQKYGKTLGRKSTAKRSDAKVRQNARTQIFSLLLKVKFCVTFSKVIIYKIETNLNFLIVYISKDQECPKKKRI
jgi:uncharacterized protein YbcC (UPF0753/DUF2309 family)